MLFLSPRYAEEQEPIYDHVMKLFYSLPLILQIFETHP